MTQQGGLYRMHATRVVGVVVFFIYTESRVGLQGTAVAGIGLAAACVPVGSGPLYPCT